MTIRLLQITIKILSQNEEAEDKAKKRIFLPKRSEKYRIIIFVIFPSFFCGNSGIQIFLMFFKYRRGGFTGAIGSLSISPPGRVHQ